MLLTLIIATGLFTCGALYLSSAHAGAEKPSLRSSLLSAAIAIGVAVVCITEPLSLFRLFGIGGVTASWAIASCISGAFLFSAWLRRGRSGMALPTKAGSAGTIPLLCGVAFYMAVSALIAMVAPPNNGDSMVYHMTRVAHWLQDRSVEHFPTSYTHNVYYTPWAEYAIAHLQILASSDRFANMVQWAAMAGSVIGVSLVAKELGADERGQVLSSVLCVTVPMGILQASSTQNDYVAAFWLICLAHSILLARRNGIDAPVAMKIGASLGLALLTKGTAYYYGAALAAWFSIVAIGQLRRKALKPLAIVAVIALALNAGYYWRNFALTGSPIPPTLRGITIVDFSPPLFISNVIRNAALHLATPFPAANRFIEEAVRFIHGLIGVNAGDPRITEYHPLIAGFRLMPVRIHEDTAGNPLHLFLMLSAAAVFFFKREIRARKALGQYLCVLIAASALFCLFVKWNLCNSRYQLPLFALASPFVAAVLACSVRPVLITALSTFLMTSSLPWLLCNETRPLIGKDTVFNTGRTALYFSNRPDLLKPSVAAAEYVKSQRCDSVGIFTVSDPWEYPFWVLLKESDGPRVRIEDVNADNATKTLYGVPPFNTFDPCAVISIDNGLLRTVAFNRNIYRKGFSEGPVSVFMKSAPSANRNENIKTK